MSVSYSKPLAFACRSAGECASIIAPAPAL